MLVEGEEVRGHSQVVCIELLAEREGGREGGREREKAREREGGREGKWEGQREEGRDGSREKAVVELDSVCASC